MSPTFLKSLHFKLVNTHITNLGTNISRNPKLLFAKSPTFHDILLSYQNSKHLISRFRTAFKVSVNASHLREAWAKELGVTVSAELWEESLSSIQYCSVNSRQHRPIQFKILQRVHYSKQNLVKYANQFLLCVIDVVLQKDH